MEDTKVAAQLAEPSEQPTDDLGVGFVDHELVPVRVIGAIRQIPLTVGHDVAGDDPPAVPQSSHGDLRPRRDHPAADVLGDIIGRRLGCVEEPLAIIVAGMVECVDIIHGDDRDVMVLAQLGEDRGLDHVLVPEQPVHRPAEDRLDLVALNSLGERLEVLTLIDAQPPARIAPLPILALVLDVDQDVVIGPSQCVGLADEPDGLLVMGLAVAGHLLLRGLPGVDRQERVDAQHRPGIWQRRRDDLGWRKVGAFHS